MLRRGIDYVWAAITPGRSHLDVADTRRPSRGMAFCRWRPRARRQHPGVPGPARVLAMLSIAMTRSHVGCCGA